MTPLFSRPRLGANAMFYARRLAALVIATLALVGPLAQADSDAVIEHAFGDTRIGAPPQRVVTLYQGATDSAVALGIEPVGVVDSWLERPMYRYLRDALGGVEHVGLETQPNLEKVAWLDPDLIVATRFRHQRVRPLLEQIAPTLVSDNVFDFKATLALLAEATGRERRARDLLEAWDLRIADLRTKLASSLGSSLKDEWPQKAAVVRFKSDHVRIYNTGFAGSILTEIGFAQPDAVDDDGWGIKLTSEENIPVMNADVIFVLMDPDDPAIVANYQHWSSHPLWQRLDAVERGRVYQVDAVNWIMGGGIMAANAMLDDLYAHYDLAPLVPAAHEVLKVPAGGAVPTTVPADTAGCTRADSPRGGDVTC